MKASVVREVGLGCSLLAVIWLGMGCTAGPVATAPASQASAPTAGGGGCIDGPCPTLAALGCGAGTAPTFYSTARILLNARRNSSSGSRARGNERIDVGSHGARMLMLCDIPRCPPGYVAVDNPIGGSESSSNDCGGPTFQCAPPPPSDCPTGSWPEWVANPGNPTQPGRWQCTGPCDVVVQYGSTYGDLPVCTGPVPTCGAGNGGGGAGGGGGAAGGSAGSGSGSGTPVILIDSQTWDCMPDCNNGDYDRVTYGGMNVCIPC